MSAMILVPGFSAGSRARKPLRAFAHVGSFPYSGVEKSSAFAIFHGVVYAALRGAGMMSTHLALLAMGLVAPPSAVLIAGQVVSVPIGSTVTLSVSAEGTQPFRYTWRRNGIDIPGATAEIYTIANAQFSQMGDYIAIVSNTLGQATSDIATLQASTTLVSQTIAFNALPAKTFGDTPFTPTATASSRLAVSLTSSNTSVATVGSDNLLTIVGAGTTTLTARQLGNTNYAAAPNVQQTLTVAKAPLVITADDKSRRYGAGNPAFTAKFAGFVNGQTLATSGVTGTPSMATSATVANNVGTVPITLTSGTLASENYRFSAFNSGVLTITPAPLTVTADDKIRIYGSANPSLTSTIAGFVNGQALTTSDVTGSPALSTTATTGTNVGVVPITISIGTLSASNYSFDIFNNGTLTITKSPVDDPLVPPPPTLTPPPVVSTTAPSIATHPASQSILAPASVAFSVVANGNALDYQWSKDGMTLSGATSATLNLNRTSLANAGRYSVRVFNSAGYSVTSNPAYLTIEGAPNISGQPSAQIAFAGSNVSFSVTAQALPAPTFQWRKNGAALAGQTNATLMLTGVTLGNAGTYTVVVRNVYGVATSANAELILNHGDMAGAYFGTFPDGDSWALYVRPDYTATYLTYQSGSSIAIVTDLTLTPDGTFGISGNTLVANSNMLAQGTENLPSTAKVIPQFTLSGRIVNGQVTGKLVDQPFAGTVDQGGSTSTGFYKAPALLTATGTSYSILGPSGKVLVVTTTPGVIDGATGTVGAANELVATTSGGGQISLAIDDGKAIAVKYTPATSTTPINFAGLLNTVRATSALANISIRSTAGVGAQTLIVGFAIAGGGKPILVRGIGPGLAAFGLADTLPDPKLELIQSSPLAAIGVNDNWDAAAGATFVQVGAFGLPSGSRDAAIFTTLAANSYTAKLTDIDGATGIALVELYDTATDNGAKLVNISARSEVGTDGSILIAGFNLSGTGPRTLLMRAIGPGLTQFGVVGALADPRLELFAAGNAVSVATNDNWDAANATAFARVGAFNLAPNSKDAVLLVTLNPGSYTAQVSGVGHTTGVALVEVYEMP